MERLDFEGFGGVRLAGDAFGSADDPAVLLLPTAGQSRAFWHGSARALAEAGRYAICVDLRGHGDSGHANDGRYDLDAHVADLRAILSALPSRALVVAAGMGAIVGLALFCSAGIRAASSSTENEMLSKRGRAPHHFGLRVSVMR